jgi:hypothetical protein
MTDDEKKLHQKLHQLARDTAAELSGWQVETRDRDYGHYTQIEGPDSAVIGFYLDPYKKTVNLRGVFPVDRHGKAYQLPYKKVTPSINVSLNKTGAQVAADIHRRLWPDYEPLLAEALASHAQYAEHENTSIAVARRLAKVVEAPVEDRDPGRVKVNLYRSLLLPEFHGDIEVSGDSVTLNRFYLTPEQAEALLRALVKAR